MRSIAVREARHRAPPDQAALPTNQRHVERFNGRISDVLATTRFPSRKELHTTIERYVKLYNDDHLPQRALGHKTPRQALRAWRKDRPELFVRRPNKQADWTLSFLVPHRQRLFDSGAPITPVGMKRFEVD